MGFHVGTNQDWGIDNSPYGTCTHCPYDNRFMKDCKCNPGYEWSSADEACLVQGGSAYNDCYSDSSSSGCADTLISVVKKEGGTCDLCRTGSTLYKCTLNGVNITSQNQLCLALGYKYDVSASASEGYTFVSGGTGAISAFNTAVKEQGLSGGCSLCSYATMLSDTQCTQSKYKCTVTGNCSEYTLSESEAQTKAGQGYKCVKCPLGYVDSQYNKYRCTYGSCATAGYTIDLTKALTDTGARDKNGSVYGNNFRSRINRANLNFYSGSKVYTCEQCPSETEGSENFYKCRHAKRSGSGEVTQAQCPSINDGIGKYNVSHGSDIYNKIKALETTSANAYSFGYSDGYSITNTGCVRCPVDVTNQYYACRYKGTPVETTGDMCRVDGYKSLSEWGVDSNTANSWCKKCSYNSEYYKCEVDAICKRWGYTKNNPKAAPQYGMYCPTCPFSDQWTRCYCEGSMWSDAEQRCVPCTDCYEDLISGGGYSDAASGGHACTDTCKEYTWKSEPSEGYECEVCTCFNSPNAYKYKCTQLKCPDEVKYGGYSLVNKSSKGYDCQKVAACEGKKYYDCSCEAPKFEVNGICSEDQCPNASTWGNMEKAMGMECYNRCEQQGPKYGMYENCACPEGTHIEGTSCVQNTAVCDMYSDSCSDGFDFNQSNCSCSCNKSCTNGLVLNKGTCQCYCPSGKVMSNGYCEDNQCKGNYQNCIDGYSCSGLCSQVGNPNYGKYSSVKCNKSTMLEIDGECVSPKQACLDEGYDSDHELSSDAYDCYKCEIDGKEYPYWGCDPKDCPKGTMPGSVCSPGYKTYKTDYKSGETSCIACIRFQI